MKHVFSFYLKNFFDCKSNSFEIKDKDFYNRLIKILRLKIDEEIIIFDDNFFGNLTISSLLKNSLTLNLIQIHNIKKENTQINVYLPILEKHYLEAAIEACAQNAIENIFLVKYNNSKNFFNFDKEIIRLNKICIAACEQSKQYSIPKIHNKIYTFEEMLLCKDLIWFYENANISFQNYLHLNNNLKNNSNKTINFTCGPEAGFSESEIQKMYLKYSSTAIRLSNYIYKSWNVIHFSSSFFRIYNTN